MPMVHISLSEGDQPSLYVNDVDQAQRFLVLTIGGVTISLPGYNRENFEAARAFAFAILQAIPMDCAAPQPQQSADVEVSL